MAFMNQEKKKILAPGIKAVCEKYWVKCSIKVNDYMQLTVTLRSWTLDFAKYYKYDMERFPMFNEYYINDYFESPASDCLKDLFQAMNIGNHDRSDSQSDYFDVGWYTSLSIGDYEKPYEVIN